jgi:hypothetical protein
MRSNFMESFLAPNQTTPALSHVCSRIFWIPMESFLPSCLSSAHFLFPHPSHTLSFFFQSENVYSIFDLGILALSYDSMNQLAMFFFFTS